MRRTLVFLLLTRFFIHKWYGFANKTANILLQFLIHDSHDHIARGEGANDLQSECGEQRPDDEARGTNHHVHDEREQTKRGHGDVENNQKRRSHLLINTTHEWWFVLAGFRLGASGFSRGPKVCGQVFARAANAVGGDGSRMTAVAHGVLAHAAETLPIASESCIVASADAALIEQRLATARTVAVNSQTAFTNPIATDDS